MTQQNDHNGQVISYLQDDAFYIRRAQHHIEKGELLEALVCYRNVQEKNPDSPVALMEMAWLYAQLRYYDRSNELLLRILTDFEKGNAEAYYALGSNFYALGEFPRALECLGIYLQLDPSGIYAEEAEYLIETLREDTEYADEAEEDLAYSALLLGFRTRLFEMDAAGELPASLTHYGNADDTPPLRELLTAYLQIAITCFIGGDTPKAIAIAREILEQYPDDLAALCNLALFYLHGSHEEEAESILARLRKYGCQTDEDSFKIAVLFCEFGLHEEARQYMEPLLDSSLDAPRLLHYYALACYNAGHLKKALKTWDRMTRIDPHNPVSAYYYHLTASRLRGEAQIDRLRYTMQLPAQEILARVRKINESISAAGGSLAVLWDDPSFRELMLWGIQIHDPESKHAMLHLLASVAGRGAIPILKDFLLRRQEDDRLKKEVLGLLKQLNAPEPYTALMRDGIVEINVSMTPAPDISDPQLEVLNGVILAMRDRYDDYRVNLTALWMRLISGPHAVTKSMRNIPAWQAALEYRYALEFDDHDLTIAKAADIYGASPSSVSACLQKIYKKDDEDEKHGPTYY